MVLASNPKSAALVLIVVGSSRTGLDDAGDGVSVGA
jgi:hypothetical protein